MIYLDRVNIARENKITTEEKFPISEQGYTTGKLLDGTKYQILLDTRASDTSFFLFILKVYGWSNC